MSNIKITPRSAGVTVRASASGITVVNSRGHEIRIAVSPSSEGFNPLELQAAALGVCTSLGLRRHAALAEVADRLRTFEVQVEGFKAADAPSRLERFEVRVVLEGDVADETKRSIVARAEEACTIANTLRAPAVVNAALVEPAPEPA